MEIKDTKWSPLLVFKITILSSFFFRIILTTTEQQLRVRSCSILGIPKGHKFQSLVEKTKHNYKTVW